MKTSKKIKRFYHNTRLRIYNLDQKWVLIVVYFALIISFLLCWWWA